MSEWISREELDALDALEQQATKRTWSKGYNGGITGPNAAVSVSWQLGKDWDKQVPVSAPYPSGSNQVIAYVPLPEKGEENAALIVATRNAHPRTSATLREAMRVLAKHYEHYHCTPCADGCEEASALLAAWNAGKGSDD